MTTDKHSKIYYHEAKEEYLILLAQGKFKCISEKIAFGDRLNKRLAKEKEIWERLQVSVVAGVRLGFGLLFKAPDLTNAA